MNPLLPKDIRRVHDKMLERFGGLAGEYEPGSIDFMAEKPFMAFNGQELYPGLFLKAAVLFHGFATRQFFCDGNKRTAYGVTALFLRINGYVLTVSNDELYTMAKEIANGLHTENEVADWLRDHV